MPISSGDDQTPHRVGGRGRYSCRGQLSPQIRVGPRRVKDPNVRVGPTLKEFCLLRASVLVKEDQTPHRVRDTDRTLSFFRMRLHPNVRVGPTLKEFCLLRASGLVKEDQTPHRVKDRDGPLSFSG